MPGTVLGTWDTSMHKAHINPDPHEAIFGGKSSTGDPQTIHTHTHREVESMLEGEKCFGKTIDQSTVDQDYGYEGQFAILNQGVMVVGLPEEKVTLKTVEDMGCMGILEKPAPCRRNSQWKGLKKMGARSVRGTKEASMAGQRRAVMGARSCMALQVNGKSLTFILSGIINTSQI